MLRATLARTHERRDGRGRDTALQADPRNARRHSDRNKKLIRQSLEQVGAGRSILIDAEGIVRAGNGVFTEAQAMGLPVRVVETDGKELIAVQRTDLRGKDAIRAAALDNIAGDSSSYDYDAAILAEIARDDAVIAALADEDAKLRELLRGEAKQEPKDAGELVDKAAELQAKWQVQRGDVWQVGKHRLMCGDSTNAEDVAKLMRGERARLVWTDPPYGVKYGDKLEAANPMGYRVRQIQNDNLSADELESLIRSALKNAADHCVAGAAIYVASPAGTLLPTLIKAFVGSGFDFHWGLIWLKDQLVLGRGDYHFKHENLLYGWKPDGAHYFIDDRKQTSVFEYPRPKVSDEHPTMKPPELIASMLRNSSEAGDLVYDAFNGSGSTLVACEQTGRIGRGMEIEPKYCAVTLERLSALGLEATRNAG